MSEPRTTRPPLVTGALSLVLLVASLFAALMMRPPVTGVPPVLSQIAETLALSPTQSGLVTTLPLLCFGVFALVTPVVAARMGVEPTLLVAMVVVTAGVGVRLVVTTPTFFTGTLLVGLGIAMANVVVPAVVRTWFSHRLALMMGLYSLSLQASGAMGPLVTSMATDAGMDWSGAIGLWVVPGVLASGLWLALVLRLRRRRETPSTPSGLLTVARRGRVWLVMFVMGTQSWLYYTLMTWLPALLRRAGVDPHTAGLLLAAYSLVGMPGSLLAGPFVTHRHAIRNFIGLGAFYFVGLVLLLVGGAAPAITGAVMCGLTTGAGLAVALTLIAHQPDPRDVPAVSALAQGGGYLWAALGPVLMGALYAATGGFEIGIVVLMVLLVGWVLAGVVVMRQLRRAEPVVISRDG